MAEAQLKNGGLSLRAIYEEVSDQPVGTVLRSDPAAGVKLDQGVGVNLFIAAARGAIPPPSPPLVIQIPAPDNPAPAPGQPIQAPHSPAPSRDNPAPAPTPTQTQNPAAGPVILGIGLVNHPDSEHHDCATGYRFNFSQQVSMTQPGRVTYRWLRSDEDSATVEYIDFANPGTQIVTTWWQGSGQPEAQLAGWRQIEILAPAHLTGQRISFSYICPSAPTSADQDRPGLEG